MAFLTSSRRSHSIQISPDPDHFHHERVKAHRAAILAAKNHHYFRHHLESMHKHHLAEIQTRFKEYAQQVIIKSSQGDAACAVCQAHHNRVVSLADERRKPTLPLSGCECKFNDHDDQAHPGFCRCYYEPVVSDK